VPNKKKHLNELRTFAAAVIELICYTGMWAMVDPVIRVILRVVTHFLL